MKNLRNLLFLNYLGHLVMKGELHFSVAFFDIRKENTAATAKATPDPLNAPAAI